MPLRVLVVDEHPVVLLGYRQILESAGAEVSGASSSEEAVSAFSRDRPAASLIDRSVRAKSGLEIMRKLLDVDRFAKVVIVGKAGDHAFAVLAMESGAKGVVRKDEAPARIAEAVGKVVAGGRYLSPDFVADVAMQKAAPQAGPQRITEREAEVIRMIAHGRSMSEVAADLKVSYRSVANACNSLRWKLNARTQMEMVRLAVMLGIC